MKFLTLGVCVLPAPTCVGELAQTVPTWANFHALLDCINAGGTGGVTSVTGTAPIVITGTPAIPNVTITDFIASGASHARGAVPDPGAVAGTTKFLREDATWQVPTGGGTVTSVTGTAPIVITGAAATPNVTITVMGASGGTHAEGSTPDTPVAAGTTKFLREDATWIEPPTGASFLQGQEFTATGNFTVPADVTSVWWTGIGAGAGGSGQTTGGGGGGGGGAGELAQFLPIKVTPGDVMAVTIGAHGTGGVGVAGTAGGTTSFGPFNSFGGNPSVATVSSPGFGGGARGGASTGVMGTSEGPGFFGGAAGGSGGAPGAQGNVGGSGGGQQGGTPGTATGGDGGGGGGASTQWGHGGVGGNGLANGSAPTSTAYGAGGGAGGGHTAAGTTTGGDGMDGYGLIQWISPP